MFHRLLHLLPPELAHRLTLVALAAGLAPNQPARGHGAVLFGKELPGFVGLSGGADKNAQALSGWRSLGFSFVETGTVTLEPRTGNPGTRIWRMGDKRSLVNWMGLPNLGLEAMARNLGAFRRTKKGKEFCVGVSMASPQGIADELRQIAETLAADADFFTLNASCPNVSDHEAESALSGIIAQLEAAVEGAGGKPVLVKLAPTRDEHALRQTVHHLVLHGAAGFIACNTLPYGSASLAADAAALPQEWPNRDGTPVGGYSGPALLDISRQMVQIIRSEAGAGKVVIGVGGITCADDAKALLDSGADAVQLYTALVYQGASLLRQLNRALHK